MTDPQPRPGVIARLSEPAQLPAALVDQVLDATDEERAAAAGELLDRTRAFLEQSGAIKPSMSVLQLRHNQVEVLAAIYGLVSRWWAAPGWRDRSLGDILNVAPTDVAETVMRMLRVTGFLPPAAEPEEEQERRRQRPPPRAAPRPPGCPASVGWRNCRSEIGCSL